MSEMKRIKGESLFEERPVGGLPLKMLNEAIRTQDIENPLQPKQQDSADVGMNFMGKLITRIVSCANNNDRVGRQA